VALSTHIRKLVADIVTVLNNRGYDKTGVSRAKTDRPKEFCYHSVNSSSHSVNGDIAIQWEWSNFDHS